jgi:hypothetical protein
VSLSHYFEHEGDKLTAIIKRKWTFTNSSWQRKSYVTPAHIPSDVGPISPYQIANPLTSSQQHRILASYNHTNHRKNGIATLSPRRYGQGMISPSMQ